MKVYCFAGPNGSGKSTTFNEIIYRNQLSDLTYINADKIAKNMFGHIENLNDRNLLAAQYAEKRREELLENGEDFMFETVLSTDRNLKLLQRAKERGAEIIGIYVLTRDSDINVARVAKRVSKGGHDVSVDKIKERYNRCMQLLPDFMDVCDTAAIFDNTKENEMELLLSSIDKKNICV